MISIQPVRSFQKSATPSRNTTIAHKLLINPSWPPRISRSQISASRRDAANSNRSRDIALDSSCPIHLKGEQNDYCASLIVTSPSNAHKVIPKHVQLSRLTIHGCPAEFAFNQAIEPRLFLVPIWIVSRADCNQVYRDGRWVDLEHGWQIITGYHVDGTPRPLHAVERTIVFCDGFRLDIS
jgi:hypothetical protein